MKILIVDPDTLFSRSARVALANHPGANTVVTLCRGFDNKWDYDAAIFRIPSIRLSRKSVRARSKSAENCLNVLEVVRGLKILHMVYSTHYPFWFYQIGTDEPATPEDVLSRSIDPKTNVFTGYYIAPDWRVLLDLLIVEKPTMPKLAAF